MAEFERRHPNVIWPLGVATDPRELSRVTPSFPEAARKSKRVLSPIIVVAVITETGTVTDPTVVQSDHPDLDPSVLEAVAKWRYEPARVQGWPVAVFLVVTVSF